MIKHLNNNKRLRNEEPVEEIPEAEFKDKVQMTKEGKELKDYMDKDVYEYWKTYVLDVLDEYIKENTKIVSKP